MKGKTKSELTGRGRGRPREFDADQALEAAMEVFWRKGFEGTSLSDLTAATGLSRPSLYAAFGDKETLYHKVLDRYSAGPSAYVREAMEAPTAYACVEQWLSGAIDLLSDPETPSICMIAQGTLACGEEADAIRQEVAARRQEGEVALRARFERAVLEGEVPPDTDTGALAGYFVTILRGLGVSASSGATRNDLLGIARMALRVWPRKS